MPTFINGLPPSLDRKLTHEEQANQDMAEEAFSEDGKCLICGCQWENIHSIVIDNLLNQVNSLHCDTCVPNQATTCWRRPQVYEL